MKLLIYAFFFLMLASCSKTESNTSFIDCEQTEGLVSYEGGEVGCRFHYVLTTFQGQEFIELRAHCADLTRPYVIDVDCTDICETAPYDENSLCGQYLKGRVEQGIVLIEK